MYSASEIIVWIKRYKSIFICNNLPRLRFLLHLLDDVRKFMWPATPLPSPLCSSPLSTITLHPFHRFTSKYLWYQSPASTIDLVTFTKFKFSKRNIHPDNWSMLYCLSGGSTSKNAEKCAIFNGSVIGDLCNLCLFFLFLFNDDDKTMMAMSPAMINANCCYRQNVQLR